jgi:hypothetical protein
MCHDNQSYEDGSRVNSRNVVFFSNIPQTMGNVQHNVPKMNHPLSQTFRESLSLWYTCTSERTPDRLVC